MTTTASSPSGVPLSAAFLIASCLASSTVAPAPPATTWVSLEATDTMQTLSLVTSSAVHSTPPASSQALMTLADASSLVGAVAVKPTMVLVSGPRHPRHRRTLQCRQQPKYPRRHRPRKPWSRKPSFPKPWFHWPLVSLLGLSDFAQPLMTPPARTPAATIARIYEYWPCRPL